MHGQFILVQLENENEAVLGRITSFSSDGKLSFGQGEEYNIRAMQEGRDIPDDLRQQYLRYRVNIRVLGAIRREESEGRYRLVFVPSHRRLPHFGSRVAFPSIEVLRELAGHNVAGEPIGNLAFGEFIYASSSADLPEWARPQGVDVQVRFDVASLVSRRSFVFARAGFGKSNLNKLLFSALYREMPVKLKDAGRRKAPVGTLIFDPDGEYFWPDDNGRPGLCDVPHLRDTVVVFTSRAAPSAYYGSFVVGNIKLDIRRLLPSDVTAIALDSEKQGQQNVLKLKGLASERWEELVNLIHKEGNGADEKEVARIMKLSVENQLAEVIAARSNMTVIVRTLHDPDSLTMDLLMHSLKDGKICVIDISQMRGKQSLILSGLILRRIFDRNQTEFTAKDGQTIPVIAVIEEAQSVLGSSESAMEPYIAWVKEGRKYDLGALLITQQPGSISTEILSQGDNWFLFHLLSAGDLKAAKMANAHFSDDLLSSLLNEPIPGQGVMWSSVSSKPYPVPFRVQSFEKLYSPADPGRDKLPVDTYAAQLKKSFARSLMPPPSHSPTTGPVSPAPASSPDDDGLFGDLEMTDPDQPEASIQRVSVVEAWQAKLAADLSADERMMEKLTSSTGVAWGSLKAYFLERLPQGLDKRDTIAYEMVAKVLTQLFGKQETGWEGYQNVERGTKYVRRK
jgi:hypothetical protein